MKIIFMGDSTLQYNDETTWPQVGWPQALEGKLRPDVELLNFAKNGRSTKSFIELGNFENALKHVDENSIVILEFGHNDEHDYDPERFTRPEYEYRDNLIYMVESCRKRGAYVMLVTPVFRRKFLEDGTIDWSCHKGYREAMIQVGKDTGTDVIDMTGLTAAKLQEMGFEKARELYMNFDAGIYPNYPEGMNDNTHLRMKGAEMIAGIFLEQIKDNSRFKGLLSMINLLHVSPVSASFELENDSPFYAPAPFDIYVNGEFYKNENRNVFTVFDLQPDTEYEIKAGEEVLKIRTLKVNRIVNVLDHGIENDGSVLVNEKIQKLLDESDHDLIVFPEGQYYCAPLNIRSNTYIYLKKGAEIIGSNNRWDYPIIKAYTEDGKAVNASWEGEPNDSFMSLISSFDSNNIMLVGEGTINGNADKADWWVDHRTRRGAWRPNNFFINRCENVSLVGLSIINSPCWNLHPFYSDNLDFINLTLRSVPTSPNTDGFDPESCWNMRLLGTQIFVGDDCIAIKSGKKIMADKFYRPTDNLQIRNCFMGDGHGAVVFGSESSCGIKNVTVSKCIFKNTDRGLRIKTKRGRGHKAVIENVSFDNILMDGVLAGFVINMFYYLDHEGYDEYADSKEYREVTEMTPHAGEFLFKNIRCLNTRGCAGYFYGLPESPIEKITLKDIEVTFDHDFRDFVKPAMIYNCERVNNGGFYFYNVKEKEAENVIIEGEMLHF